MSENDYNHLSFDEQQQMILTYRLTSEEVFALQGSTTQMGDKMNDGGEKMMTGENNNPGITIDMFGPNTETHTIATPSGQNNTGTYPEPGQTWAHYKGGRYEIIAMCNHTTTHEVMVIYKSKSFNGFHARPYSEWHDEVWNGPHCVRRFELISW